MACAPRRSSRSSKLLERSTCLEESEVELALSRGGSQRDDDNRLSKAAGVTALRPDMPRTWSSRPQQWLTNLDIDSVMVQYETYPDFVYLGCHPCDFFKRVEFGRCVSMCTLDPFCKLWKDRKLGAMVVNLDVHTGRGTHWVAVCIDFRKHRKPSIFYYDSLGDAPPKTWHPEAWGLFAGCVPKDLRRRLLKSVRHNTRAHQKGNTECGMFAMMFIDAIASGTSPTEFCRSCLSDTDAFRRRTRMFNRVT